MPATVPPPRSLRASRRAPAWTPRLGLLVGLLAVFRARLPTCHAATANPMDHDDPADTVASFSEAVMREAMWDMYDADTGAALDNSKAISLNVDAEDVDEVDLALFVDDAQWLDELFWRVLTAVVEDERCRETFLCVLARRPDKKKVFELFSAAAERVQQAVGGWRDYYASALLQSLSKEESRMLVRWHAEGHLEESAIREIIRIAEGHPFFLGELTQAASHLPEEGRDEHRYSSGICLHGQGGRTAGSAQRLRDGTWAAGQRFGQHDIQFTGFGCVSRQRLALHERRRRSCER